MAGVPSSGGPGRWARCLISGQDIEQLPKMRQIASWEPPACGAGRVNKCVHGYVPAQNYRLPCPTGVLPTHTDCWGVWEPPVDPWGVDTSPCIISVTFSGFQCARGTYSESLVVINLATIEVDSSTTDVGSTSLQLEWMLLGNYLQ